MGIRDTFSKLNPKIDLTNFRPSSRTVLGLGAAAAVGGGLWAMNRRWPGMFLGWFDKAIGLVGLQRKAIAQEAFTHTSDNCAETTAVRQVEAAAATKTDGDKEPAAGPAAIKSAKDDANNDNVAGNGDTALDGVHTLMPGGSSVH